MVVDRGAGPRAPGDRAPTSAASPRRWARPPDGACPGCWCPRTTRPPWPRRCGAGSTDAGLRDGLRAAAARERRGDRWPGWRASPTDRRSRPSWPRCRDRGGGGHEPRPPGAGWPAPRVAPLILAAARLARSAPAPFLDGLRAVDARSARCSPPRIARADHGLLRPGAGAWWPAGWASSWRWRRPWRATTARSSSTRCCPAACWATSTAACRHGRDAGDAARGLRAVVLGAGGRPGRAARRSRSLVAGRAAVPVRSSLPALALVGGRGRRRAGPARRGSRRGVVRRGGPACCAPVAPTSGTALLARRCVAGRAARLAAGASPATSPCSWSPPAPPA